ncbi:MAG: hypothetical protein ABWY34_02075 [Pseudoxanthomonas sp.]
MSANAEGYWMDRSRAAPALRDGSQQAVASLVSAQEPHRLDAARAALRDRAGISQQELLRLARERRHALQAAIRPRRILLAIGLFAVGIAMTVAGSLLTQQLLLLSGLGLAFIGLLVGCVLLSELIGPQTGELTGHLQDHETPASLQEIAWLARATRSDAELRHLTLAWWKDSALPIRKQDLELVRAFQRAKAES